MLRILRTELIFKTFQIRTF